MGCEQDHIYSHIPSQNCPTLNAMEFTNTYVDGLCKIYLPKEAFVGGDVRVTIRSLESPGNADTTEQILNNELTPAVFPVYSYSSYTFSSTNSNCPASAEQTLLCVPPTEQASILSAEAIATLYILYDADIKKILRSDLPIHCRTGTSGHCLGFFDGVFPEHNVLSTLLSHALSSQFGWLNLALIQFLQPESTTAGYWARALSEVDDFDVVSGLFSSAYTATLRKKKDSNDSFRLVLVVVHEGDTVINMESQLYRPSLLTPLGQDDVRYKSTETLGAGVDVYLRRRPGLAVLFGYLSQPGRGSSRGASCMNYMDILGQHCTFYPSGHDLCPVRSKLSKNDLLDATAEQPIYLSTDRERSDWIKLFTLDTGDIFSICGYWMADQPVTTVVQEADGAIYFANKDKPAPLAFFLLVVAGCSVVCICIIIAMLFIISFCTCLRLYALDMKWSPCQVPLSEKQKDTKVQGGLEVLRTLPTGTADAPVAHISPLLTKEMFPLLLPRGDAAKKLAVEQKRCNMIALAVADAAATFDADFPLGVQELSSITKDTVHSNISADSTKSSMVCALPTESTTIYSEDKRDIDALAASAQSLGIEVIA